MNASFRLPAAGGPDRAEEIARSRRAVRWFSVGVGVFGLLVGGGLAAVGIDALSRVPTAPEPRVILVDLVSREVHATLPARDAPKHFSDDTARQHLRLLVESCDSFSREMLPMLAKRCQAYLSPEMQARYRAEIAPSNHSSPLVRYPQGASARPDRLRYAKQPYQTAGIQSWTVYWVRTVTHPGGTAEQPVVGTFHFRWQPEAEMTDDFRTLNPAGMQVVEYTVGGDTSR